MHFPFVPKVNYFVVFFLFFISQQMYSSSFAMEYHRHFSRGGKKVKFVEGSFHFLLHFSDSNDNGEAMEDDGGAEENWKTYTKLISLINYRFSYNAFKTTRNEWQILNFISNFIFHVFICSESHIHKCIYLSDGFVDSY